MGDETERGDPIRVDIPMVAATVATLVLGREVEDCRLAGRL